MEYPPNSFKSKDEPDPGDDKKDKPEKEVKQITQVTTEPVRRRPPGIGKRFKGMFFGGDARSASQYVIFDVLVPAAKDTIVEGVASGFERLVFGESRGRHRRGYSSRGYSAPPTGPTGYVNYNRYSAQEPRDRQEEPRSMSRRARSQHNFDEIILNSRQEAEAVIDALFELVSTHESASVADLYESVGLEHTHVDNKWGWFDMRGSSVTRVRGGGYLLNLPDPRPLG